MYDAFDGLHSVGMRVAAGGELFQGLAVENILNDFFGGLNLSFASIRPRSKSCVSGRQN